MDIERIYKQLSGLRDHCESMIDEEDADKQIWKDDRDALDAVIKGIEAKGLNINHSKNGGINTMSKTKVAVTAPDGHVQKFSGDTVIIFTVSEAEEYLKGRAEAIDANVAYVGKGIPEPLFADTISSLVASFIDTWHHENPMLAAFELFSICRTLKEHEKELTEKTTREQKSREQKSSGLKKAISLFDAFLSE